MNLESLEPRDNPSITFVDGVVTVTGSDGFDVVYLWTDYSDHGNITVEWIGTSYRTLTVPEDEVTRIDVNLLGGTDFFIDLMYGDDLVTNVSGGAGDDAIYAGRGAGTFDGGAGNDTLVAGTHPGYVQTFVAGSGTDGIILWSGNGLDVVTRNTTDFVYGSPDPADQFTILP